MGAYDLRCEDCGRTFEVFVPGFLKDDHKVCPDCGSSRVDQLFSGFVFGGGSKSEGSIPAGACAPSHRHGFG